MLSPASPAGGGVIGREKLCVAPEPSPSSRNLVRFDPGDPRAVEAGRKGAAAREQRRRCRSGAAVARRLEQVVEQHLDRIAEVFESVLVLEPDPSWKASTKLDFRTRQISQIEKCLNRVKGLPVARQQVVAERAEIDESIASLPGPVVERLLVALVTAGSRTASRSSRRRSSPSLPSVALDLRATRRAGASRRRGDTAPLPTVVATTADPSSGS
jgi:hypothetical protein